MAEQPLPNGVSISKPARRIRWATQRVGTGVAQVKRNRIMSRLSLRGSSNEMKRESGSSGSIGKHSPSTDAAGDGEGGRRIFFNMPLPADSRDEEGKPLVHYSRNKIRTAKYTPLTFIPKNLWYQFHNIANVYFLTLIVLGFFSVFGVNNPGLNAVPLIVIIVLTAFKDGIEDWRRTVLDNELNNAPVHRLMDWENVNSAEDEVSLWRRIKKATSHGILNTFHTWQQWRRRKSGGGRGYTERAMDEERMSIDTRRSSYRGPKKSTNEGGIQMTPVSSPLPKDQSEAELSRANARLRSKTTYSFKAGETDGIEGDGVATGHGHASAGPYGSLIDPIEQTRGKARFRKDYWKNVHVGDFVRIHNDDQIPADIAILSTSEPDGACYVETKNLDGETNLKVRQALHCGQDIRHATDCEKAQFILYSEQPHTNLYAYSGLLKWTQRKSSDPQRSEVEKTEPLTINNLLLRGCNLRNTEWIIGVVVFTGPDTKIMLNAGITPSKRSRISRQLNYNVLYNFTILLIMCLVSGIVNGVTFGKSHDSWNFFEFGQYGDTPGVTGLITFWSAIILYQNLVPISLYISLEIIKTAQAFFIYSDTYMYYERLDYPCTPKSWNISDDLGQVEYIFSDKTGTLTQNVMEYKKCTVNGVSYGEAYTEALAGMQRRQGIDVEAEGAKAKEQIAEDRIRMLKTLRGIHDNPYLHDDELTFVAPDFAEDLTGAVGEEQAEANKNFMLALALCHTVTTERTPGDPPKLEFKAQSPDEAALVATARDCGFAVMGRQNDTMIVNVQGVEEKFEVLNTLEFNSSRKRMSAIIRMPDNRIVLFCKGADSVIYSRLKKGEQSKLRRDTAEQLEMFAREGLRTLCIAQKVVTEGEHQRFSMEHDAAATAINHREEKIEEVFDAMERDLSLIGGTAIEDRLQDGVPDTIALLGQAGIKLWVLTGDKVETAINIGFACNLLSNEMDLIVMRFETDDLGLVEAELSKHLHTFQMTGSDTELRAARRNHEAPAPTHAIVIDGDSLKLVLDEQVRRKFLLLCKQCKAVLCCRVSPSQKAAVVQMVKNGLDVMTLSVGDGANDVAMIQEADIGVGIAGEEGRQAVMSSDYAIGQFRFLQRLVLVHGRWSYRRLSETIANFFYKNIVWTFALYWYQIFDNFDCNYLFDYSYVLLFNLAFTSLPIIFMGILDQDVSDKISLAVPQLYRRGIERKEWTSLKFWMYMLDALYQSVICYFMPYFLFAPARSVSSNGLDLNERVRYGNFTATSAIFVVNFYVLMNTYRWDWLMVLLTSISILSVWFWSGVYSSFVGSDTFYKAGAEVFGALSYWVTALLIIIISLLPRFAVKAFQKVFFPYDVDIIREQARQGKFGYLDDLPSDASPAKLAGGNSFNGARSDENAYGRAPKSLEEDMRPIYPPSVAPTLKTTTTNNRHSTSGSINSVNIGPAIFEESPVEPHSMTEPSNRPTYSRPTSYQSPVSLEPPVPLERVRTSMDRPRPSFDRIRNSMDIVRPSFEASNDFTSASRLMKLDSNHSELPLPSPRLSKGPSNLR